MNFYGKKRKREKRPFLSKFESSRSFLSRDIAITVEHEQRIQREDSSSAGHRLALGAEYMEKQPNLSWAYRTDLTVATSPELIPHQNLQSAGHRLAIGAEYMEKEPNLPWALRTDLTVATSPELIPHQNLASVEWDSASSPCADEMQTDSPSNIRTPVPEGRSGMEVIFSLWASCDAVASTMVLDLVLR